MGMNDGKARRPGSHSAGGGTAVGDRGAWWLDAGQRTAVFVRGRDAVKFIDGFTTAAVATLASGSGAEGFFADAKGAVLALAAIFRTDDGVWIDAFAGGQVALAEHLERYHIREQIEILDETSRRASIVVAGPTAAVAVGALLGAPSPQGPLAHVQGMFEGVPVAAAVVDWAGAGGFLLQVAAAARAQLITALEALQVAAGEPRALEQLRIERGWPAPADIPPKSLPQELFRANRAISFTKGCYLGQETVARLDALGHVNRRLVGIASQARLEAGDAIHAGGTEVGTITSACESFRSGGWLALAILPVRACAADASLAVADAPVRVVDLPLPDSAVADPPPPSARGGEVVFSTTRFQVVRVVEPGVSRERAVVEHPGSVVIVPVVSPLEICLVEVVRVAVGKTLLELPAGTLDRAESLTEAAARELTEETGYRAGRITPLGVFWMSPGFLRERMHLFMAEDLVPGPQALEPGEQITTRVVTWTEAIAMCLDGRIEDAKTVAGLLLCAARSSSGRSGAG